MRRKGIVVNETEVLVYGQLLTGRKFVPKANGVVELEKQWAKQVLPFAYQTVVKVQINMGCTDNGFLFTCKDTCFLWFLGDYSRSLIFNKLHELRRSLSSIHYSLHGWQPILWCNGRGILILVTVISLCKLLQEYLSMLFLWLLTGAGLQWCY